MTATAMVLITPEELKRLVREAVREEREAEAPEVLTLAQACKLLRMTAPTLRKCIRERELPVHYRGGGHPRFRRDELLEWLEGQP